jgi:hypothetical protein
MSDLPKIRSRHWTEYVATVTALAISLISLWVAVGTEDANRKMVAATSWPFLQVDTRNVDAQGRPDIALSVVNSGVGPAKVESFEVSWRGKEYLGSAAYLRDCCGREHVPFPSKPGQTSVFTGGVAGTVIRAGESRVFLDMPLGPDNGAAWHVLDRTRFEMHFRICYCSVFDECWLTTLVGLEPQRVSKCPAPKVPYGQ